MYINWGLYGFYILSKSTYNKQQANINRSTQRKGKTVQIYVQISVV